MAYCAYVFGLQHRYTYVLRTIPGITEHLKRLDEAIDEFLITHLLKDHSLTELERIWISLPARLGGLGINIISEMAPVYYRDSRMMTKGLVDVIKNQHNPHYEPIESSERPAKAFIMEEKKKREEAKITYLLENLTPQKLRVYEAMTEKGAYNWLTALPLQDHGFYLDKLKFWDSLRLRFGIDPARLPNKCVCDQDYTVEHALNCSRGGFISTRHNDVRDFTAELLSEVCKDVAVEPVLTPLTGEKFALKTANKEDHARLDVSARGV